jgi:hypothetical protein
VFVEITDDAKFEKASDDKPMLLVVDSPELLSGQVLPANPSFTSQLKTLPRLYCQSTQDKKFNFFCVFLFEDLQE